MPAIDTYLHQAGMYSDEVGHWGTEKETVLKLHLCLKRLLGYRLSATDLLLSSGYCKHSATTFNITTCR